MRLIQQTPACADFDVVLDGENTPSFRILLPEHIRGEGLDVSGCLHTIPGDWELSDDAAIGTFRASDALVITTTVEPRGTAILAKLAIENLQSKPIHGIRVDICASVNHLPGQPDWANRAFIPSSVPLVRDLQGRYWFEKVTPENLAALTDTGWVEMHPCPDDPDADRVPQYSFAPNESEDACACAVASEDGQCQFFQAWNTRCHYCTPCPGNACMHLRPLIADMVQPGDSATIEGMAGIFRGSRAELTEKIRAFCGSNL